MCSHESSVSEPNRETIKELLENGIVTVHYKKKDGSSRRIVATLAREAIQAAGFEYKDDVNTSPDGDSRITVWDTKNNGWRSLIVNNIMIESYSNVLNVEGDKK